jgi:hypothetical protein
MGCAAEVDDCRASAVACACGVVRCVDHGHAQAGHDAWCPWLAWDADDADDEAPEPRAIEEIDLSTWEG